jgi:hypothetical protein
LPPVRKLGSVDLASQGQSYLLPEYQLHNLSDADWIQSEPSIWNVEDVLKVLAPQFGYDPNDTSRYQNSFRNPVFTFESAERLFTIYNLKGKAGVQTELQRLHKLHVI